MASTIQVDKIQDTGGNTILSSNSTGTFTYEAASGANFTALDADNISAGTLAVARGGTGTTSYTAGITEADQWRLTTNITSDVNPIASNLERVDDASFAKIGTGMSVSSGYWTFPSTGLYMVKTDVGCTLDGDDNVRIDVFATINDSAYDQVAYAFGGGYSGSTTNTANTTNYVNVTDVSNVKVSFGAGSISGSSYIGGSSDFNYTSFTFIRLGDSQ